MENHNNIDQLFGEESKKDEADTKFPAFEKVWKEVEHRLDQKENRQKIFRLWIPYGIAAGLAIIFGSLFFINYLNKNTGNQNYTINKPKNEIESPSENSTKTLAETSNLNNEKIENLNQKFKESTENIPLSATETIAYEAPKQIVAKDYSANSSIQEVKTYVPQATIPAPSIQAEIMSEKQDIVAKVQNNLTKDEKVNEVVVTGFAKKRMDKGDFTTISAEQFKENSDSIKNSKFLAQNNAEESYSDDFKIDMKEGSEPLYVVDGYIANNEFLKNYDAKNIYSLNILEGKSATKLYGDYGKKGVVVITTKGLSPKQERKLQKISKKIDFSAKGN